MASNHVVQKATIHDMELQHESEGEAPQKSSLSEERIFVPEEALPALPALPDADKDDESKKTDDIIPARNEGKMSILYRSSSI